MTPAERSALAKLTALACCPEPCHPELRRFALLVAGAVAEALTMAERLPGAADDGPGGAV